MDKKGFLLIEALMGIFLLGIIVVTCLPILNTGVNNIRMTKEKMQMLLMAESIIEQVKAFDYSWEDDEYLFDISLSTLIDILNDSDNVSVKLPLDCEDQNSDYYCIIDKKNAGDGLWKLRVILTPKDINSRIKSIDIVAFVPVPKRDEI